VVRDAAGTGWIVAGLSSFITSYCGDPKSPSSYTRVSAFGSWIQSNTGMTTGGRDPRGIIGPKHPTAPGRFHIDGPRSLSLQAIDPAGAVLYSARGTYPAGDVALPAGKGQGAHWLRITGVGINETIALPGAGAR
jgi:hypothetical protein